MNEPIKIMSPREHYQAATHLLTDGLDKLIKGFDVSSDVSAETLWKARAELVAVAQVHATLATVPQRQFEAWKSGGRSPNAAAGGRSVHPSPNGGRSHAGRPEDCGHPLCMDSELREPATPPTAAQRAYDHRCYCRHSRQLNRCLECAIALPRVSADPNADGGTPFRFPKPSSQCTVCGVPCWSPHRMLGSRCDLPGCVGTIGPWSGDTKQWYAPVEPRP